MSLALITLGCRGGTPGPGSTAESGLSSALSVISSAANDTEGGASARTGRATCDNDTVKSACSGGSSNVITMDFAGCTVEGTSVTVTGGWTNTYDSSATCTSVKTYKVLPFGGSVEKSSSTGVTLTVASGAYFTSSTEAHTTFDNTTMTGGKVSISHSPAGTRSISVTGVHNVLYAAGGSKVFDHSVLTTSNIVLTGSRALGTRAISSGAFQIYHNLAQYISTVAFSTTSPVTWGTPSCCYPTSGQVTLSFSQTNLSDRTFTFSSTCGSASYTTAQGESGTVTLSHCQ